MLVTRRRQERTKSENYGGPGLWELLSGESEQAVGENWLYWEWCPDPAVQPGAFFVAGGRAWWHAPSRSQQLCQGCVQLLIASAWIFVTPRMPKVTLLSTPPPDMSHQVGG